MPRSAAPWAELGRTLAALERWLLPSECLVCQGAIGAEPCDPLICATCRHRWVSLPQPQCERCGQPSTAAIACRTCTGWPEEFGGVRSAVWLDDSARRAVHFLKYEGWRRVAEPMAQELARRIPLARDVSLIPIPLGPTRLRTRGYNQSAVLATALAERLGVPVAEHALARRRDTPTQTALTPEARRANLAGAFVARRVPPRPVLVDDVFTTGATLVEAAQALLEAGAPAVSAVSFARAPRPLAAAAAAWRPTSWSLG